MPHFLPISAALITAACTMSSSAAVSTDDFVEPITPGTGDGFGASVAIGDNFFVVGAPNDDDAFSNAGSVTVYFVDMATGSPSFSVLEVPATLNAGAGFGYMVAADGDTFVVAAPAHHDLSASPIGAVYVYTVGSTTVSLDAVLQPSTLIPPDLYGQDVDIVGDTIIVGAPGSAVGQGSVFVYTKTLGTWSAAGELYSSHGDAGDGFGWAVALDHDNEDRMIIGAPWDSDSSTDSGRVHIYEEVLSTWASIAEIDESDIGASTDRLGLKLDFDGDHFAVGEPLASDGLIHLIGWNDTLASWGLVETLQPTTTASYSLFGESFALDGELLGVGVRQSDLNGTLSGAGYLFRLVADGDWAQLAELEDENGSAAYSLGQGVSVNQGFMIMGAPGATASGPIQSGLAFGWDVTSTPGCPADIEMTATVDADDLAAFLLAWGMCANPSNCPEDIDGDGEVGVLDLIQLLANWGGC